MNRHLLLNYNLLDFGFDTAWRLSSEPALSIVDADRHVAIGRAVERGGLDAVFLSDGPALRAHPAIKPMRPLEPFALLGVLAAETEYIGLIASASTSFTDPVDIAIKTGTLNRISGGRAAWNVVTTFAPEVAANFGLDELPSRDERYRLAEGVVDEVLARWATDGWSETDRPVIVQAGGSGQGRDLAARVADIVFTATLDTSSAVSDRAWLRAAATERGRAPESVLVVPGLTTVIGSTEAEAATRLERFEEYGLAGDPVARLSAVLGIDLTGHDPDGPVPLDVLADFDPRHYRGALGFRTAVAAAVVAQQPSVREAARRFGHLHHLVVGTPEQVAHSMEHWFRAGAADGFNVMCDVAEDGLDAFVDQVVPILVRRGLRPPVDDWPTGGFRARLDQIRGTGLPDY